MYQFVPNEKLGFEKLAAFVGCNLIRMTSNLIASKQKGLLRKFFPDYKKEPYTKGFIDILARKGLNFSNFQARMDELRDFFIRKNKIAISFDPLWIDARILAYPDLDFWSIEWQDEEYQHEPYLFNKHFLMYIEELQRDDLGKIEKMLSTPKIKPIMEQTAEVEAFLTKQNPLYF